jgi:hypothetical protein
VCAALRQSTQQNIKVPLLYSSRSRHFEKVRPTREPSEQING